MSEDHWARVEFGWRLRGRWARSVYGEQDGRLSAARIGGVAANSHVRFFYGPNAERKAAIDRRLRERAFQREWDTRQASPPTPAATTPTPARP